jgi:hypothetical protein
MATKHTFWVAICTIIATIASIFVYIYSPTSLKTIFLLVGIASIILTIISWIVMPRNSFFILSALTNAGVLLANVLLFPQYGFFVQFIAGAFSLAGFILAVLSVQKQRIVEEKRLPPPIKREEKKEVTKIESDKQIVINNTTNVFENKEKQIVKQNASPIQPKPKVASVQKKTVTKIVTLPPKTIVKKVYVKPMLSFYDVKTKKSFRTNKYTVKVMNNRKFAVTKAKGGHKVFRILGLAKKGKKIQKKSKKSKSKRSVKKVSVKKTNISAKKVAAKKTTAKVFVKTKSASKKVVKPTSKVSKVAVRTKSTKKIVRVSKGSNRKVKPTKVVKLPLSKTSKKTGKSLSSSTNVNSSQNSSSSTTVIEKKSESVVVPAVKSSKKVTTKEGRDITINIIEK